jgi:hypothetical protein
MSSYYSLDIALNTSEQYSSFIPEEERHDLMTAYQKRLTSDDEALSLEAARRWSIWEESTNRLIQDPEGIEMAQTNDRWSRAFARIENHYFVNKVCLPDWKEQNDSLSTGILPRRWTLDQGSSDC